MESRIIRRPEVERRTQLSTSTLYRLMGAGMFPKPVKLGPRAVGWLEADINKWVDSRPPSDAIGQ